MLLKTGICVENGASLSAIGWFPKAIPPTATHKKYDRWLINAAERRFLPPTVKKEDSGNI